MNLKSMSVDQLTSLRQHVEAALNSKVIEQRRAIESELAKLGSLQGGATHRSAGKGKVGAKYRNPDNGHETWTGRGLKPLWLSAAIKAGKRLEHFLIANASRSAKAKGRKAYSRSRRRAPQLASVLGIQTLEGVHSQALHPGLEVEREPIEPSNLIAAA
jgi:DNA-binding protein H-NS